MVGLLEHPQHIAEKEGELANKLFVHSPFFCFETQTQSK